MIRFVLAAIVSFLLNTPSYGQAFDPPPIPVAVEWSTVISDGPSQSFPDPALACQRQRESFNPNATDETPVRANFAAYYCKWSGGSTILPGTVTIVCPSGTSPSGFSLCLPSPEAVVERPGCDTACSGQSSPPNPQVGNPISLETSSKVMSEHDYSTEDGLFSVQRHYRSRGRGRLTMAAEEVPGFGYTWHGLIPGSLTVGELTSSYADYLPGEGGVHSFAVPLRLDQLNYEFTASAPSRMSLTTLSAPTVTRDDYFLAEPAIINGPAEMRLGMPNGDYILLRRAGLPSITGNRTRTLVPIEHGLASGYRRYFDYNGVEDRPYRIRDSFGRQMSLTWAATGWDNGLPANETGPVIKAITLPDGTSLAYDYDYAKRGTNPGRNDRLVAVKRLSALGSQLWARSYVYENTDFPYAITGVKDGQDQRRSTYSYGPSGLAASTELAGSVNKYSIVNGRTTNGSGSNAIVQVTNPLGRQSTYNFYRPPFYFNQTSRLAQIYSPATATVPADIKTFSYYDQLINTETDERGVVKIWDNDPVAMRPGSTVEGSGTASAITTNILWHPTLDLRTREDRPGLRVDYSYDSQARMIGRTETDTTTYSLPYATAGQQRSYAYGWAANGRLLSINGPRPINAQGKDDIVTFTYDPAGNLQTSTNSLGHVTTYGGYDANGRPALMTDANGIKTAFTYDELGRNKTITLKHPTLVAQDAVTTMDYDPEGRIIAITAPATEKLMIDYDLAGRATTLRSAGGERIDYVYNAMSNVISQTTKRTNGTVSNTIARTFDSLGRMLTETLGPGRTQTFAYDKGGNVTQITSARGNAMLLAFDPLSRLISSIAPDAGTTAASYNALDDVTSATDAAAVQTTFVRNGFGEAIQEISPDRGTSTYYFDAAGDMTAMIDGRGQRVDYVRDIAGRVLTKTPVGRPISEKITYTYDTAGISGSYGKGRLATVIDSSGTTKFKYDHRGNILTKQQTIGTTATASLVYVYNLADRITQITYPSGRQILYTRDTKGRVTQVRTRATSAATLVTLMSAMTYEPFAALKTATFGNTLKLTQDWGNDGRLASKRMYRTTGGANLSMLSYSYDNDDNITAIIDAVDPTRTVAYAYDSVGRLTRFDGNLAGGTKREDQLHDKNGNRTRVERRLLSADPVAASIDTYTTTAGTNRLASISAAVGTRSLSYDARGNLSTETRPLGVSASTAYDGYARLTGYSRTGEAALSFGYNGLDDRVAQVSGATTTRYVYDSDGRVIGEYGASATDVKAEYIWVSPEVANDNVWGGGDGIGGYAPLAVSTAPVGGTATLSWIHANHIGAPLLTTDASGTAVSPSGYTQIAFPGQLRTLPDLYYNRYRDYDPTTGRYIQADPIGLDGDANPYAYAMNNPLRYMDPTGEFVPLVAVVGGIVGGALFDFSYQYFIEGKTLNCVDWLSVGISGGIGAFGGNILKPALKLTKGSALFSNVSRRIRRAEGLVGQKIDLHHGILPRRWEKYGDLAQRIVNHPSNLRAIPREAHRELHRGVNVIPRLLALPVWAQGALGSVGGGAAAEAFDGD
jgi:RHS repeat-associated protein